MECRHCRLGIATGDGKCPLVSPMQMAPRSAARSASASSIVPTMMIREAPFAKATAAVVKARKVSITATAPLAFLAPSKRLWIVMRNQPRLVESTCATPEQRVRWQAQRGLVCLSLAQFGDHQADEILKCVIFCRQPGGFCKRAATERAPADSTLSGRGNPNRSRRVFSS